MKLTNSHFPNQQVELDESCTYNKVYVFSDCRMIRYEIKHQPEEIQKYICKKTFCDHNERVGNESL